MRIYKGILNLGGSLLNQVPLTFTAAEAAVLKVLHGDDALNKIEPTDEVAKQWTEEEGADDPSKDRTDREERQRLQVKYGDALRRARAGTIETLFGIASMPLPTRIDGVDDEPLAIATPKKKPRDMSKLNAARAAKKAEREAAQQNDAALLADVG